MVASAIKLLTFVTVLTMEVTFISARQCVPFDSLNYIKDSEVSAEYDADRALHSLPPGFVIKESSIPTAGLGVFAVKEIPAQLSFGPYGGVKIYNQPTAKSAYAWMIKGADGKLSHFVDAKNKAYSNWLRYINCSPTKKDENMVAIQYKNEIYYRSTKVIPSGTELLVWYGAAYGEKLRLKREKYLLTRSKLVNGEEPGDGNDECGSDHDEGCCPTCCANDAFRCQNGNCVPVIDLCDGKDQCGDNSDERFCSLSCSYSNFLCKSGECIPVTKVCDGTTDCADTLDEAFCACLPMISPALLLELVLRDSK